MTKYFKIALFLSLIAIEYLATTTREIEVVSGMWDKSNHFIAFFTLYILLSFSYPKMKLFMKVFYLMLFAIHIEILQHFIEGRFFSLMDVVADSIGIAIGIGVLRIGKNKIDIISILK